jgi:hypothetical protein
MIQALCVPGIAAAVGDRRPKLSGARIGLINSSRTAIDPLVIAAIQKQLDQHFRPVWGHSAELVVGDIGEMDYSCLVGDETDVPGEAGYHGIGPNGRPLAKLFADTLARGGLELSVALSHEILEMVADPWGNARVLYDSGNGSGALYAMEVCDPVQTNQYLIDGVAVSDFVTPQYFRQNGPPPYDYLGILQWPFCIAPYGRQVMMLVGQLGVWT